jgi:FkbM family methyltransferase
MRTGLVRRTAQAISKFFFCLRVAGDRGTFFRLMVQSKRHYDKPTPALSYPIRFLSVERIIHLRTYAGDIRMFYEIFWEQAYRLPFEALTEPAVIVDAGANIGMAALYFSILYPRAQIFCIESDPHNFEWLEKNLAREGERVVLIEAALYDRDGEVPLARERWAYNSKIDEGDGKEEQDGENERDGPVSVKAMKLDTLLDRYGLEKIDLLKIDIEGAEEKLFAAETGWLARVGTILIEVHRPEAVGTIGKKLMENGFYWQSRGRMTEGGSLYLASRMEMTRLAKG